MQVEKLPQLLEVLPQRLQHGPLVQRCGGMEQGKQHEFLQIKRLPAYSRNPDLALQKCLRRPIAQRTDQLRPNHGDLLQEKRFAGLDLLRFGVAVIRRAAFDHIGDVDIRARQPR